MNAKVYKSRRRPKRAALEDLEKAHQANYRMRAPKPLPAGRKRRQGMRALSTVPANEQAVRALRPDGTDQKRKVAGVPYLYVRITPSGRRTFCATKRLNAQRMANRMLGAVGQMTVREAKLACQVAVREWRVHELERRNAELEARVMELEARNAELALLMATDGELTLADLRVKVRGPADA